MKPAMTPQQAELTAGPKSGISLYRELAAGKSSWLHFLYYEFCMFGLSGMAGLPGFGLRALLYPHLFAKCGSRPGFGRGILIRRPRQISIGQRALFDDYAVLDVRGDDASIEFGDHVSIGRFTTVAAKGGQIKLGNGVNIGSYCRVATQTRLEIGESVLTGAYTYIGPGNHQIGDSETPLIARAMETKGGVQIGAYAWLGCRVTVLDGVSIGEGSIIGAHSLVKDDIPAGVIAVGCPAKVIRSIAEK
jgi:acetyltransferase-like isoleucine patch superfamily enzyme